MAKKILVIDDEPELVKAITVRFKTRGYEVIPAYDGQEGVDKAGEIKPDLILLDIIMPKLDGYEVAEKLLSDPAAKDIPIVAFTASQQKELESKCKELGITDFIKKPFETADLLNVVNKILKKE